MNKDMQGKVIYLTGSGNTVRRSEKGQIWRAVVVKVSRVFVAIMFDGRNHETKLRMTDSNHLIIDDANAGYYWYETERKIQDERSRDKIARLFIDKFRYSSCYKVVSLADMEKVAELLGIEVPE